MLGLHVLNRTLQAVEFQLASIDSAVKGIVDKPTYGPEYGHETGERLSALATTSERR